VTVGSTRVIHEASQRATGSRIQHLVETEDRDRRRNKNKGKTKEGRKTQTKKKRKKRKKKGKQTKPVFNPIK
jgi:hypothetical protein